MNEAVISSGITRQGFLKLLGAGAGALALSDYGLAQARDLSRVAGAAGTRKYTLDVAPLHLNLGGRHVSTIGYNGGLPGPELRLKQGERLQVNVRNHLSTSTSVHWHGIPIDNKMDGV